MNEEQEKFISLTRKYIALIDNLDNTTPHQFLSECAILLPLIYSKGLQLPDAEPKDNEHDIKFESPMGKLIHFLGEYELYGEVFDPFVFIDEEIVIGSLGDDLADIYRDLKSPLLSFDNNEINNAIWQWKFNIQFHCGDHIVDALRAIHRLIHNHMPFDYKNE